MRVLLVAASCVMFVSACTSMGNQGRAAAKISRPISGLTEIGFDGDNNELSIAVEKLLEQVNVETTIVSAPQVRTIQGNKEYTYDEVQTQYVVRVRSVDLDRCLLQDSRQMNFDLSVIDWRTRKTVLLIKGEHGCKNIIMREFEKWLEPAIRK